MAGTNAEEQLHPGVSALHYSRHDWPISSSMLRSVLGQQHCNCLLLASDLHSCFSHPDKDALRLKAPLSES